MHGIDFRVIDGAIVMNAAVHGKGCTRRGGAILDTGAGYLALDAAVCNERSDRTHAPLTWSSWVPDSVVLAPGFTVRPRRALSLDLAPMSAVADVPLIALLGHELWADAAIVLDYRTGRLGISRMPPAVEQRDDAAGAIMNSRQALGDEIIGNAVPLRFALSGDGKIVVRAALDGGPDTLTMVLDTGATKTVLFASALAPGTPIHARRALRGLRAPTVIGSEALRMVRAARLALRAGAIEASVESVDVALLEGGLRDMMDQAVGRPVHGLIGYSFLRRFRTIIDYPRRVLWLERIPVERDARPFEYSSIGVQLRRDAGRVVVDGVVLESPADRAGVHAGDRLVAIGGRPVGARALSELAAALEGPPGSAVRTTWSRAGRQRSLTLTRAQLL